MEDRIDILSTISELKSKAERFNVCFEFLLQEDDDNSDESVIKAWSVILNNFIFYFYDKLTCLKHEIQWSLIDDQSISFLEIKNKYRNSINKYKFYADENIGKKINDIISLIDEGAYGFRQSIVAKGYYEKLFNKHYDKYSEENKSRLELIYTQDLEDLMSEDYDETTRKNKIVTIRREKLFSDKYGMKYHDLGRSIAKVTSAIIDNHEENEINILSFIDKLLAYNLAVEKRDHKEENEERVYENIIFKSNVDVNKVANKLQEFVNDEVISAKRHFYIAYRVFLKKGWLIKDSQKEFRDQIYKIFGSKQDCTKDDFSKNASYIRNKKIDYFDWTLEDNEAPRNCDDLKKIAMTLHNEFIDEKYALPGMMINRKKIVKF